MIDKIWNCLNLKVHVKSKEAYGTEIGFVQLSTGAPKFVCDIAMTVRNGRKEISTIIDRGEMQRIRDSLSFILENTEADK